MNKFGIAIKIMNKNIKSLVIFEAVYKLFTTAIFTPLISQLVKLALHLAGINYLTNARVLDFLTKPTTIAILFLTVVLVAIFSLMEIGAVCYCYNMSYHGYRTNVTDMIREGMRTGLRLLGNHNFLMLFFVIIIMPVTHLATVVKYISSVHVMEFLIEFMKLQHNLLRNITIVYAVLSAVAMLWITSIYYYSVEKMNFRNARKASFALNKKRYIGLILSYMVWHAFFAAVMVFSYVALTYVITRILMLILKKKLAYTISLYVAKRLYEVAQTVYSFLITPVTLAIVGGYYYARKKKINEQIVIPLPKENKTATEKKAFFKLRKTISIIVLVSAFLNILYISFDIGIEGIYNVQLFKKTVIAAHRGYSAEAPENTIPAFEAAIEHFSDYVELDVQETKDGEVIVMHDSNFKRVAGVNKHVWEVTYDEIQNYDVGKWFSPEFEGTSIPRLEDVLAMAKGRLKLNIEIKLTGHEKNLEENVVRLIEEYDMEQECVITSFQKKALKNVKRSNPEIKTGYILKVAFGDFSGMMYADALSVQYAFASSAFINSAHSSGKKVYVWTVNSSDLIYEMIKRGADMIITDDPVLAKETITSYETNPYVVKLIKSYMK
ncbi:MAG: glycerophosphodiester phosphodiesterase [Lachnospiraceae bacterium]|nr:glycerophosphodiester phosphodiesterase [Lachnospiraceae bacterium]